MPTSSPASRISSRMDSKISAHRSVRRRHAKRFVCQITGKRTNNMKWEEDSHRLVVGYPISGGAYVQRALVLVLGRNRGNRQRFPEVRGPHHPLCRVPKPQQMQPANTCELNDEHCPKRGPHTWRVIAHLSDCSGGTDFFRFGCSIHGRRGSSRPLHQLLDRSGV
jgi:hypothetical protein